jgi:hypothetical protein
MEQSEAFKSGAATIKALEKQLEACRNIGGECEQRAVELTKEIEEHFAKCMNTLAARKEVLLREIAQKVSDRSKYLFIIYFILALFPLHKYSLPSINKWEAVDQKYVFTFSSVHHFLT